MAIIRHLSDSTNTMVNSFPDQFVSEAVRKSDGYIKRTMDFFATKAYASYFMKKDTIGKNYKLINGIITREDFYIEPEVKSFTEVLSQNVDLPKHVKHYPIINTPINILLGEMTNRQDSYLVRALDEDSKSEQFEFLNNLVMSYITYILMEKLKDENPDLEDIEVEERIVEMMKEQITEYTSVGEKWGSNIIDCLKADFNIKKLSEDVFKHILISSSGYFHIYEDNSKLGFNLCVEHPINVWDVGSGEFEYSSDPTERLRGPYAIGTIKVMELSEIIEAFPFLTKKEIDHLRKTRENIGYLNARPSNLGNPSAKPGWEGVMYDTYDPAIAEYRIISEGILYSGDGSILDMLGSVDTGFIGDRFVVVRAYWVGKRKIGKLTYMDPFGMIQTEIVDESYKPGSLEGEISIEWGWKNQWYQGVKIGQDVYHVEPLKILDYSPIIGLKMNVTPLLNMMKPFQILYNICLNQLYELFQKEIGNVVSINTRRIPKVKDGSDEDALDMLILEAKERGILQDDDSPENLKAPISNTSVARNIDLSRSSEMITRINIATWLRNECWGLIGMNNERVGRTLATMTATASQNNLKQSYAHTEPLFVAHQHLMGILYQALLDASLYIESSKPMSTISYINSKGTSVFTFATPHDLNMRDLKIYAVSRAEDIQRYEDLKKLAYPMLQNPETVYEAFKILSSNSIREMEKVLYNIRKKTEMMQERQIEAMNRNTEAKMAMEREKLEMEAYENELERMHEAYQNELDRINKKEIQIIESIGYGKVGYPDENSNLVPDPYEMSKLDVARKDIDNKYQLKLMELQTKYKLDNERIKLELEKLKVMRENMQNDLEIAKINLKNKK